jgi:ribosomal protein L35
MRRHAMKSHNLQKKSSKRRRGFRKEYEVAAADGKRIKKLLGVK